MIHLSPADADRLAEREARFLLRTWLVMVAATVVVVSIVGGVVLWAGELVVPLLWLKRWMNP